jgi:hypothetical protein
MLGNNTVMFSSTCHYISLNILSPMEGLPYRFRTSYLSQQPVEYPLGNRVSIVKLNWRSILYTPQAPPSLPSLISVDSLPNEQNLPTIKNELVSSGAVLWDRVTDT